MSLDEGTGGESAEISSQLQDASVDSGSNHLSSSIGQHGSSTGEDEAYGNMNSLVEGEVADDKVDWGNGSNFTSLIVNEQSRPVVNGGASGDSGTRSDVEAPDGSEEAERTKDGRRTGGLSDYSLRHNHLEAIDHMMYDEVDGEDVGVVPSDKHNINSGDDGQLTTTATAGEGARTAQLVKTPLSTTTPSLSKEVLKGQGQGVTRRAQAVQQQHPQKVNDTHLVVEAESVDSPQVGDVDSNRQLMVESDVLKITRKCDTNEKRLRDDHAMDGTAPDNPGRSRKTKRLRSRSFTPSFTGRISNRADVEQIFDAARRNMCKIISERIDATGVALVGKGFIFDACIEGGLQRWTEGLTWSRSRPNRFGFQLYNEVEDQMCGRKMKRIKKDGGLLKYTATDRTPGSTLHCVWYTRETLGPKDLVVEAKASDELPGKYGGGLVEPKTEQAGDSRGAMRTGGNVEDRVAGINSVMQRRYQPLFSHVSNYVGDPESQSPAKDEIQEFNKAANAAWKYYQRNKRKSSRSGDGGSESDGSSSGSGRNSYYGGIGVHHGYPQPPSQHYGNGAVAPYAGAVEFQMFHEHQRRMQLPHNGNANTQGGSFHGPIGGQMGRGDAIDSRNGRDLQNMRDHTMGQHHAMSRMLNKYRLEDIYAMGGGQQMQMYPRAQGNYHESPFDDEEFSRIGHNMYSETRSNGDIRSRQQQQQKQQQYRQHRMGRGLGGGSYGIDDGGGRFGGSGTTNGAGYDDLGGALVMPGMDIGNGSSQAMVNLSSPHSPGGMQGMGGQHTMPPSMDTQHDTGMDKDDFMNNIKLNPPGRRLS